MRNLIRILVLVPALVLTACGGGDDSDSAPVGEEFTLRYGDSVEVGSLTLRFAALTEESRCPINAACLAAWPGNARIQVSATDGRASEILELNTNPMFPTFVVFGGHVIELLDLAPNFPRAPRGPLDEYVATLIVDGVAYTH
jgi:hypothetical protein